MKCYLDSSVVLRYLLNGDQSLTKIKSFKAVGSSRLLQTECLRVINRYRLENLIDDDQLVEVTRALDLMLGGMQLFRISDPVLARAGGPFPVVVGTLDAIHLATALLWDPQVELFTFDKQLARAAESMGIRLLATE